MNRRISRASLIIVVLLIPVLSVRLLSADEPDQEPLQTTARTIDFASDVQPLLKRRCYQCHGPDRQESGLRLHHRDFAMAGGDHGAAIVPGDSAQSQLLQRVRGVYDGPQMPPEGPPLTRVEIELLSAWIDQGAPWPQQETPSEVQSAHWAYQTLERPALPRVTDTDWPRNAIDHFVLERLQSEELHPQPSATREQLIRRVSLDLTGLPPTPAEVSSFVRDEHPDAYERLVDRLLASPSYGERWAAMWLDMARYADSQGYEKDSLRTIWRYRDWVIEALNQDLPFDQFTREQLAGDLLPDPSQQQLIATAFHRNTMTNTEGGTDDEEFRVVAVVDRVNTTMAVWMGTTFNCCQCHSHKYDPFTQREYYQVLAFFNQTQDHDQGDESPTISTPTELQQAKSQALEQELIALEQRLSEAGADREALQKQIDQRKKELAEINPPTTPVLRELPADQQRKTHVMLRGNFLDLGDEVQPGVPEVLHDFPAGVRADRLGLAEWLVDTANPLTARVTVNRHWERIFGIGLVETSEDFGTQGQPPSHPQLLDWLAAELMHRQWSIKELHRLIVTSATYRQRAQVSPELLHRDPYNRLLARGPRVRLSAEQVRDQALAASGLLSEKIGGASVMPPQPEGVWQVVYSGDQWKTSSGDDKYRRGLYTLWRRTSPYPSMVTFDAPSREFCVLRRDPTNTPLQALVTMNDPVYVEAARALAQRVLRESGPTDDGRLEYAFQLVLARDPNRTERQRLRSLLDSERAYYARNQEQAEQLVAGELPVQRAQVQPVELAAWTVVANVLLNLDETLTKG